MFEAGEDFGPDGELVNYSMAHEFGTAMPECNRYGL